MTNYSRLVLLVAVLIGGYIVVSSFKLSPLSNLFEVSYLTYERSGTTISYRCRIDSLLDESVAVKDVFQNCTCIHAKIESQVLPSRGSIFLNYVVKANEATQINHNTGILVNLQMKNGAIVPLFISTPFSANFKGESR
jgi:hypothetical protein